MIYKQREQLTILTLPDDSDRVGFDILAELLMERPSNMIYCENTRGGVSGIISMGDVHRAADAGFDFVQVNKSFTRLMGFEYMRARVLFHEKANINALPIVDDMNRLIGAYERWDDGILAFDFVPESCAKEFWEKRKKAAIAEPAAGFPGKRIRMEQWKTFIEQNGVKTEVICLQDIEEALERNDLVLVSVEDEKRGLEVLYRVILDKGIDWDRVKTFQETLDFDIAVGMEELLHWMENRGIYPMTITFYQNKSEYWKKFGEAIEKKFSEIGRPVKNILHKEFWANFFDEFYNSEEYVKECIKSFPSTKRNGVVYLNDTETVVRCIKNGERRTVGQPEKYEKNIYFFGPCIVFGLYVEDAHTIESFMQGMLNGNGYRVRVLNYGSLSDELSLARKIVRTEFQRGDIVIVYDESKQFDGIPNLNLAECWEREQLPANCAVDIPKHCNYKANRLMAKEIYEFLKGRLAEANEEKETVRLSETVLYRRYIEKYFPDFHPEGTVGAIVMNCNPFTRGHRYLIEQALGMVDHLIIFVVEEDRSLFTFMERYAMVSENTRDLKNVTVAPSGNFILSQTTFPEYFLKVEDEDLAHNVENDLTIFAEHIAPMLGITCRFVGEEPADRVTNAYNLAMKRILPERGIRVVEIPRKTVGDGDDTVISASLVRKKLEHLRPDELSDLIPEGTRKILELSWD